MTETERPARRAKNESYAIAFRQEAVRLVESGLSQREVMQRLGVSHATLLAWLKQYGTAVYFQMRRKLFTPIQKQQIVRELLDGRLSEEEALLKYGLRLKSTLRAWVAAYQAAEAAPPGVPDPPAAAGEVAALAAQLRQAQWQIEALHTLIDQAEATYNIAIRKKGGAKPSK
jgi:transposase-like protein